MSISRVVVALPINGGNKAKWEALGVEWAAPVTGDRMFAEGILPLGWSCLHQYGPGIFHRSFAVLDAAHVRRAGGVIDNGDRGYLRVVEVKFYTEAEEVALKKRYDPLLETYLKAKEALVEFTSSHDQFKWALPKTFK